MNKLKTYKTSGRIDFSTLGAEQLIYRTRTCAAVKRKQYEIMAKASRRFEYDTFCPAILSCFGVSACQNKEGGLPGVEWGCRMGSLMWIPHSSKRGRSDVLPCDEIKSREANSAGRLLKHQVGKKKTKDGKKRKRKVVRQRGNFRLHER